MTHMDWERLGREVIQRRGYLGYSSRREFSETTGFPTKTLSDLEKHQRENFDAATLARLERALCWEAGSVAAVLAGGDPKPLPTRLSDPRSIERYGDETGIMALVAGSGLGPMDAMRVVLRIRARREEQYRQLAADVRRWIAEAGGVVPDGPQD